MTQPEHLTPTMSDRGFNSLPRIAGRYGGDVRVYESSAASGPHIWLNVQIKGEELVLHLALEDAVKLAEQIQWLAENHYQVKAA